MSAWTKASTVHRVLAMNFPTQLEEAIRAGVSGSDSHHNGMWRERNCCGSLPATIFGRRRMFWALSRCRGATDVWSSSWWWMRRRGRQAMVRIGAMWPVWCHDCLIYDRATGVVSGGTSEKVIRRQRLSSNVAWFTASPNAGRVLNGCRWIIALIGWRGGEQPHWRGGRETLMALLHGGGH
jgi:hypothetical protein